MAGFVFVWVGVTLCRFRKGFTMFEMLEEVVFIKISINKKNVYLILIDITSNSYYEISLIYIYIIKGTMWSYRSCIMRL